MKNTEVEIETDIATCSDVDLKVVRIEGNRALIENRQGEQEWFSFIDEYGMSTLYLSELKNNPTLYRDNARHFDVTLNNVDIIENFEVLEITI